MNASLEELLLGVRRESRGRLRQHRSAHQDETHGTSRDRGIVAEQDPPRQLLESGHQLRSSVARSDHDEGEQAPPLHRIVGQSRSLELIDHVVPNSVGVSDRLEAKRVLFHSRGRGRVRRDAQASTSMS